MQNDPLATEKWKKQLADLWPAAKGSLAKVYKPCIRKNCPTCASGQKHPAWLLSTSSRGKRKTMYVPLALVAQVRRAIRNGRKIEEILQATGPQLIKNHRRSLKPHVSSPPKS